MTSLCILVYATLATSCSFYLHTYLAEANVGHLELVLVQHSPQAAVKQLHSTTQGTLYFTHAYIDLVYQKVPSCLYITNQVFSLPV